MTSNPTPAPQPLTDEEVEEWHKLYAQACTTFTEGSLLSRAIARIRADGRRIERLEQAIQDFIDQRPDECIHGLLRDYRCRECEVKLKAALEDKTK